ncbi:asparagine synthase (glutamine-hydrolyzing) [Echinicola sp. CAU 1574]|uniref:asparagine synthase (glutamine-hydrolyzing) n=1 Tax=Echinicola arenosa TaxID=2774144 RepID=A0ABR9AGH2_9BACT|nr:asparagine synthase (glutamine-hydrolyzing) [Echinicola arenosa]MBD8487341.1 asparagine synthase (glutamine-hydrolyzing) [Echinicola arenosa]
MCGISGIINFQNELVKESEIREMMEKMKHRGPDDEGVFIHNRVGIGFVRLSILDLSPAGHQPMFSKDENLVIAFNGEIFNYIEIRDVLKCKYQFITDTDTEVVLASYQEWGEKCLDRLNGMFAFVIFDKRKDEIFGARDRFGVKPFYYYLTEEKLVFASEIKSLMPHLKKKEANDKLIYDYLLFNRNNHPSETFFRDIKKLEHGSYFKLTKNDLIIEKWYVLKNRLKSNQSLSPEDYRKLLKDSLKLRLRADVKIGVTLSGGIDSSAVTSCLIEDCGVDDLNTFSVVFDKNDPNDESDYIDEYNGIVKYMHSVSPTADDFFNEFENFIWIQSEPMPNTGTYIQFKVMELASKHVKVTLDGQGADEQLAGYHYFFGSYYLELLKQFKIRLFFAEIIAYIKKHKKIDALKYLSYFLFPQKLQVRAQGQKYRSVNKSFIKRNKNYYINKVLFKPKNLNDYLLQHFEYKLEHLLRYEDLNSMCFSIESRVPFLDYRLVEATLSTPSNQKIKNGETKHLLRESVKDILPKKIINRKDKKGFSNPREKWFRSEKFKSYIFDLINSESFKNRGYFDSAIANSQYKKHLKGKEDVSKEIWKWINLEIWFRKFID